MLTLLIGRKHLVRGNNDEAAIGAAAGWASIQNYAELTVEGALLVACHYPFRSWNGKLKPLPRQHDVGVDARDFRSVTLAALLDGSRP